MIRVVALAFCAIIFAFVLTHEASALRRGGGVHAGNVRGASFRGAYRGGLGAYRGYRATALGGRRYWSGGRRLYGYAGRPYWRYGAGTAALAGAYYYNYRGYSYRRSSAYGWNSAPGMTAETQLQADRGPGTCGTYFYWKDGHCNDARLKSSAAP